MYWIPGPESRELYREGNKLFGGNLKKGGGKKAAGGAASVMNYRHNMSKSNSNLMSWMCFFIADSRRS